MEGTGQLPGIRRRARHERDNCGRDRQIARTDSSHLRVRLLSRTALGRRPILGRGRRRYVVHIDCDLYESARVVLGWLEPVLATGSVLIFDDWFSFENEPDPDQHGERRAFGEWPDRGRWKPLHVQPAWNVALVRG